MGPDGREVQLSSSDQQVQSVSAQDPVLDSGKKPPRKWRKRLVWVGLISPLGIVAGVLIVGQTSLMKIVVEPILENQLGVDVTTGSIKLMPTGEIVIQDAVCTTDTIDNRAGSLIEMDQATIWVNWLGVINGRNQVKSIQIVRPTVRVSQDVESGVLNLAALKFKKGSGGGDTPAMEISNGVLEIGEHDQSGFRLLKELSIQGRLSEQTDSGVSGFEFVALPVEASASTPLNPSRGTIGLTGQMSSDGIDGVLDGVHLQDWPADIVPSRSRGVYQQLDLAGELAPTRFHVSNDGLIEIVLMLDGVSLNLPIPETQVSTGPTIEPPESLRMRETKGVIRFGTMGLNAELDGLIDDLQYNVQLEYLGLEATSPFDATLVTSFRLDDQFKPMKFLPEGVMTKLDRFENPVADVHAQVFASRSAAPTGSGDQGIKVSGIAKLTNGSAIYKKFRYPFHDLTGTIEFDPDKLVIENITGVGPAGASLVANGLFSPLGEQSVVELGLQVEGVGIDDHLIQAMDEDQRELVGALFNEQQYANLLKEELVLTRADAQELGDLRRDLWDTLDQWVEGRDGTSEDRTVFAQQLAELDRRLQTPVFDFGGSANIDVMLRRYPERPSDNRWTTDVRVKLPSAGLVSQHFPLPIVASDVEITVSDDRVELTGGHYSGLQGGQATVDVAIDLTQSNVKPVIQIDANNFPIDARLIAAIPGYHDEQSEDPDDISLRRILDRLRLEGVVECDAIIGPRSDGQLGYDVESTILRGSARPATLTRADIASARTGIASHETDRLPSVGSDPIAFDDLLGTVYITEELIIVDLNGMLSSPDQPIAPTPIEVLTQLTMPTKRRGMGGVRRVDGLLPTDFGPPTPGPSLFASAYADGLDLAMPLEHAIAVVSPRVAREVLETTDPYNPDGVIGLHAQLEGIVGGSINTDLIIDRVEHFEFDLDQTQYQFGSSWGSAKISLGNSLAIAFDEFRVPIEANSESAGEISLDGSLPFVRGGEYREIAEETSLAIVYEDGRFESPITQHIVGRFSSDSSHASQASSSQSWFDAQSIGGRFNLDVKLTPELGLHRIAGDPNSIKVLPTRIDGSLKPESLSLQMDDRRAEFDEVSGTIEFEGFEGVIDQIQATSELASIGIDGRWSMYPQQGLGVDLTIDAQGDLLNGSVRAILPNTIDQVIDRLEIKSNAPVDIEGLRITASHLGKPDASFDIAGGAKLIEGNAVIGLPITGLTGDLQFHVHGEENRIGYEIGLDAARLRAGLMRVHDAHISIIGDANNPGVILVPEISAGMHGGQIAGSAQIRPGVDEVPHYWMELHASGVRAAPVFDDLLLPPEGLEGPPRPGRMTVLSAWSLGEDLSRGSMIGDLTLTGPTNDPSKRTGRGLARISGGSVVTLPGLINLIEASNLSLPSGAPLDLAEAAFYVDGPTLAFEQLSMSSKRVEILGYGTMDWASRDLDLRFSSRAVNQIPVVSGIIEKLRDELISTRVTGKMNDPQYSVQQFGSIKRVIDAMLGVELNDQQQRMREVEEQVLANKVHSQRGSEEVVHQPTESSQESWDWELNEQSSTLNDTDEEKTNEGK